MLTLDEARSLLSRTATPLPARRVALESAGGLRLASDVAADLPLPLVDISAMDGYAARNADVMAGRSLPVAFEVSASEAPRELAEGQTARIFTGGALPLGADTVIRQEDAQQAEPGAVRLASAPLGANVRRAGELYAAGAVLGRWGERLTPTRAALLASGGASLVAVTPRPRLAVLVTGSEVVSISTTPQPGQIRNTNGSLLTGLAREASLEAAAVERCHDDEETLRGALGRLADGADLVVTSGGVSVGDYDFVPRVIEALGGTIVLHGVAMRPGRPVLFARIGGAWVAGLPGNPLACLVGWRLLVLPLAERLAGDGTAFAESPWTAVLGGPARNSAPHVALRAAVLRREEGTLRADIIPWQGSHDLVAAAAANALVRLEPGVNLRAGASVSCYPLDWDRNR
jgi:molybdopterin molybdotransferase